MNIRKMMMAVALLLPVALRAQDVSLDGKWQLTIGDKTMTVSVPHTYNVMDGLEDYAGEAVYRRLLPVTADMKGKTVRLHFGAVYHDAIVYVNGLKVGEHLNKGYTPFSMDITSALNFSDKNTLEVRTSNAYTDQALPYKRSFDWSNDGGIYRSVRMHVSCNQTIRYVHVTPQADLGSRAGKARFDVRLWNERINSMKGQLTITNRQTGEKVYDAAVALKKKKGDVHFSHTVDFPQVQLWHFDTPNLYDFTFTVLSGASPSDVSDELKDHFGFRDFRIEGHSFVLNGEKVRLPGIENMPGSNPNYGMAEPQAYMEQTVRTMKDLNTAITRFHWVQDDAMLTLMDEMGILAQEELSWWQQPWKELTPELRQVAREAVEEMIEAHYNHPCLYGWGLSNEVWSNHDDLHMLSEVAKRLDPTRLTDACCNKTYEELKDNPSLVLDLPTWNEYTGTWHGNRREDLPKRLKNIKEAIGNRPLLITEAGLCEPTFAGGDATRVDDMLYHVKEWQRWPYICGYIYFCLQDYRTQMGEEGLGRYRIRRHGVTECDLKPKSSYAILRQLMCPIDITEVSPANAKRQEGSLAGQFEVDAANRDAQIRLQVKNTIPSYTLRGYTLRYADGEGRQQTIALPDMQPGETYSQVLKNINARFHFEVVRPNGFVVIKY